MGFTHADTAIGVRGSAGTLSVTLSGAVGAGDLLVVFAEGPAAVSVSDNAGGGGGNTWTVLGPVSGSGAVGYLGYVLSSVASPGGVTITASVSGDFPRILVADRFTYAGTASFGAVAGSTPFAQGLGHGAGQNLGDLGTVPAGSLAWGGFVGNTGAGTDSYSAGFQTGSSGTPDVLGSQIANATNTGFSAYVASTANTDAALTWTATGSDNGGVAVSAYFTLTPPPPQLLPAAAPMPPGLASPAAWQFPQYRPVPPPPEPVAASTTMTPPPVPTVLPAAPLIPPGQFSPMSAATRRPALPPVYPSVIITTTGSTFTPVVALAGGSTATVTWSCPGFASQTGLTPSFNFGSAAARAVSMTVTGGGGPADVTLFNLGYDNVSDAGRYMPPAGFAKSAESVSGVANIGTLTGLVYFLADHTALASALDFTGCSALQFIQCYETNVTSVTLTGCTALKRLNVEACNISYLDLNPVAGNLYDLRAAIQQGGSLTFATLTAPMAVQYHYCVRDQTVINSIPLSQLPAIEQFWCWNDGFTGKFAPVASSTLNWVDAHQNAYTTADLTGQLTSASGTLDMHACQLASVILTGCTGLTTIDLHDNRLAQQAVDAILATVAGWGTSGPAILDLRFNSPPSSRGTANAATLTARGWTVSVDAASGITVPFTVSSSVSNNTFFPNLPGGGDTLFLVACAFTNSGSVISSSAPLCNGLTPPGAVLLQEVRSPLNGSNGSYHAVWMLPHCFNGSSDQAFGITITGGTLTALYALDVAGLGVAPLPDRQASRSDATSTAMDSGSSGPVSSGPALIIGAGQTYPGSAAGPASPWTVLSDPSGGHGWCGYQIATSPGGSYDWAQTSAGGNPWTAGVVAVSLTGPAPSALPPLLPPGAVSPAAFQHPQYRRLPPVATAGGSGGVLLPKPSLAGASPAVASAAATRQGGWWQYLEIRRYREQEFQFYASNPPFSCPQCGEPLTNAPPTDSGSSVELFCRFDGWQFPRDWIRP